VLVGRRHRTPVVVTEQSSNFPLRVLSRTEVVAARLAFRGAARVMPVSRSLQRAIEAYGIRARFRVVPNAVDPSIFHPGEGAAPAGRLLCVALLRPVKCVDDLLHALADPALSRDDWHLDVVGDGPHRAVCERLADRLGLRPRVTFHGYQPKATVADFMRRSDALVLPSRSENMPCVALEALTTGLPVIATKVGGVPEIVDDASGVLAPPGDAAALARAVTHFLDHRDEFDRASIARQATERFSLQTVGAALGDVYREVLA